MKRYTVLAALAALTLFGCARQVSALAVPSIQGLQAFTVQANYLSLNGYMRWQSFKESNVWISKAEANSLVKAQTDATKVGTAK